MPALCKRRGKDRWRAQVRMDGKSVAIKWFGSGAKGGKEYRQAVAWEEETRKALEAMPEPEIPTVSLTIRDWANAYLDEVQRRRAKSTYSEARTAFKYLGRTLGPDFEMSSLTPTEALKHLDIQNDTRSGSAANKDRKNLSRGWNWAKKFLPNFPQTPNPFLQVDRYPITRKPRYVPPEADYWKVMATLEGQDEVMLTAFFHLGARRGEIFRLKWADVDFGGERVRLATRKTADGSYKHDWIPMTQELKARLMWWWENRRHKQSEYVFTVTGDYRFENQWEGEPFRYRQHFMDKLCERAGVKPFGFHAIRHLSAVVLYQAGYPVAMIQAILRHDNATTTEKYLKRLGLDPDKLKTAVKAFENRGPAKVIPLETNKKAPGSMSARG